MSWPRGCSRALAVCSALVTTACAHAPAAQPSLPELQTPEAHHAAELAPDIFGRARQARREALAAGSQALRDEAEGRARLWLRAAIAEAARIDTQRAVAAADVRTARAEQQRLSARARREQLEHELALAEQGRAARARAQRMLAGGALQDALEAGDDAALADATSFALERGELLLAAATALGLDASRAREERSKLDALAALARSRLQLKAVVAELVVIERALGAARSARPGPTPEECEALRADVLERGLALVLSAQGATIALPETAFAARAAAPSAAGLRALARLAGVRRLHARGALLVAAGASALAQRRARELAARLRALGAAPELAPAASARSADGVAILLPSYVAAPEPTARAGGAEPHER